MEETDVMECLVLKDQQDLQVEPGPAGGPSGPQGQTGASGAPGEKGAVGPAGPRSGGGDLHQLGKELLSKCYRN